MKNDVGLSGDEVLGIVCERAQTLGLMGRQDMSRLDVSVAIVPTMKVGEADNDDLTYDITVEVALEVVEGGVGHCDTKGMRSRHALRKESMVSKFEWQRSKIL